MRCAANINNQNVRVVTILSSHSVFYFTYISLLPPFLREYLKEVVQPLTRDVACATRIAILPPCAADILVLLVDLEIYVPQPLGDADAEVDARVACADDSDFEGALVFDRRVFEYECRSWSYGIDGA
jgi:hypothetical protein